MCCFTNAVSVSNTSIFARDAGDGRQYLVYTMKVTSAAEVAMVLPIPVPRGSGEQAVTFIDLSAYPLIFTDLFNAMGFMSRAGSPKASPAPAAPVPLVVQQVGAFEASFVPTIADFSRLDQRFQLPAGTWEKLPAYRDYGFAVFKLKAGEQKIHPMAFCFPRSDPSALFLPTVHIHDGAVHEQADFDHTLFAQTGERHLQGAEQWTESQGLAGRKVDIKRTAGIVDGDQHVYYRKLKGKLPNQDTILKFG